MQQKIKRILKIIVIVFLVLTAIAYWTEKGFNLVGKNNISSDNCSIDNGIATININGEIVSYILKPDSNSSSQAPQDQTSADNVVACINKVAGNDTTKGLILRIDSYGGSPEASEEIANAIKGLNKPSVAVVRGSADSGAYLIASATDRIFASDWSDVGSIGITGSYTDNYQKNIKDGITFNQLSVGKFKDTENPDKPLTADEKAVIMRDLNIVYQDFIQKVADNRKLDVSKVKQLADGSSVLGVQAKADGLIDEIGDINSATVWLKSKIK